MLAAAAENGCVARVQAMRRHAADLGASLQESYAPPPDERDRQEADLFETFSNASSAVECTFIWVFAHACRLAPALTLADATGPMYPTDVLGRVRPAFPGAPVTAAMEEIVKAAPYQQIRNLRNVLSHRGTPGRLLAIPPSPPRIPYENARDLPDGTPPEWDMTQENIQGIVNWTEGAVVRVVEAAGSGMSA